MRHRKDEEMSGTTSLPPADDDDVVDPLPEAARRLGISYSTLRRVLDEDNGLRAVRLSRRRLGIVRRHRREWVAGKFSDRR
jgi:excisionase family DNA binding protein